MTSVRSAVESNNSRILKLLVAIPGSVSQQDLDQGLVLAVKLGYADCLDIMLKAGADPEHRDSLGNTLLKVPTESGNAEILQALIQAGCSVNVRNHTGAPVLHSASRYGRDEAVSVLLQNGAKMILDSGGCSPLIVAAMNCHRTVNVIKILIDAKCDLDIQDESGKTALHYAAHKAIGFDILLTAGANPNIQDHHGNTPMILAATEGFDNVIKSLLSHNAKPDFLNSSKMAAIHFLAMKNHWVAIEAIGCVHGNVDIIDGNNNIPLWYAVNHNRIEAVKVLLRANCKPDPPLGSNGLPLGLLPLKTALEKRLYVIAKLLVLSGCSLTPLYDWLNQVTERRNRVHDAHYVFAEPLAVDEDDDEESEAVSWFEDWVHSPHSLRQICRIWIRQHLGPGLVSKGLVLPIPPPIQDYVTLREVNDHHVVSV